VVYNILAVVDKLEVEAEQRRVVESVEGIV